MLRLFLFAIIATTFSYAIDNVKVPSPTIEHVLTGKVTHIGSSAIDTNATIQIELHDTSLMDVPSILIASTVISDAKQFPIPYTLKYNASDIQPRKSYSISAQIKGPADKLLFVNDVNIRAVLTDAKVEELDIPVIRVGGSTKENSTIKTGSKRDECAPVKCPGDKPKQCPYGYHKKDGCEICKCNDPCNSPGKAVLCAPKERCFVDKKPDGTFSTRCSTPLTKRGDVKHSQETSRSKDACMEPMIVGFCRALIPRFYYDSITESCEHFSYGGCDGNGNNFRTKQECEKLCKA